MQIKFDQVKGYATYANAVKRGEEVAKMVQPSMRERNVIRWVVIALPSGRFVPSFIINNNVPGGPGMFLGLTNVCCMN